MDTHRFKVSVNQVKPVPHPTVDIPAYPSVSSSPRTDRASTGVSQLLNEVVILTDSDEEDETRVKRELSPTSPSSSFMSSRGNFTAPPSSSKIPLTVIDLTLDSDDEDAPAPVPTLPPVASSVPSLKRKSSSQIVRDCEISTSKKFRGDGFGDRHRSGFSGGYSESTHSPPSRMELSSSSRTLPPLTRNPTHYHSPPGMFFGPSIAPTPTTTPYYSQYNAYPLPPTASNGSGISFNGSCDNSRHLPSRSRDRYSQGSNSFSSRSNGSNVWP